MKQPKAGFESLLRRPSQTKIVATVGPACADPGMLTALIRSGVDVFRVNSAHGTRDEHRKRVEDIRAAERQSGRVVAILVDLAGPKIRLGDLPGGRVECTTGMTVRFVRGASSGSPMELTTTYAPLIDELHEGDRVVLADGTVALSVEAVERDAAVCRIVQGGILRNRQGVNLPGVKLSAPVLSDQDRETAVWAAGAGVDFISLSFVRSAADIAELRELLSGKSSSAQVIAKIEKPEALDDLEPIVKAADGVMVARGDLGVEIDIAQVPVVQKRIIRLCRRHGRPVIIATQMLDSMQHSRLPTRAEATDVANAVLDGADACMLSGETAVGEYPREAVEMMHRIARATEPARCTGAPPSETEQLPSAISPITEATTEAAGQIAQALNARMIVVASSSGRTALAVSRHRPVVPIVGASASEATLRRMCLYWGLVPLPGAPATDGEKLLRYVVETYVTAGDLSTGDRIVLVCGTGLSTTRHNMVVVHEIE